MDYVKRMAGMTAKLVEQFVSRIKRLSLRAMPPISLLLARYKDNALLLYLSNIQDREPYQQISNPSILFFVSIFITGRNIMDKSMIVSLRNFLWRLRWRHNEFTLK